MLVKPRLWEEGQGGTEGSGGEKVERSVTAGKFRGRSRDRARGTPTAGSWQGVGGGNYSDVGV